MKKFIITGLLFILTSNAQAIMPVAPPGHQWQCDKEKIDACIQACNNKQANDMLCVERCQAQYCQIIEKPKKAES